VIIELNERVRAIVDRISLNQEFSSVPVVVTYNRKEFSCECLDRIARDARIAIMKNPEVEGRMGKAAHKCDPVIVGLLS